MINPVSVPQTAPIPTSSSSPSKQQVDVNFLDMLTEQFNNDDIPDAHEDYRAAAQKHSRGGALISMMDYLPVDEYGNHVLASREQVQKDFDSFRQMMNQALDEAGISKNPSFDITSGASGKLYVTGDHPDKEAIEKILNDVPNIRDTYMRMSAQSALIAAFERHEQFSKAYAINQESAVRQYRYLFASDPCDAFSIHVSEDGFSARLDSYGQEQDLGYLNRQAMDSAILHQLL